jgi:FkbM family methyltransferase
MTRLIRPILLSLGLLAVAIASGYFGMRVGRTFAFNQMCCNVPQRHNLAISIREQLGLLQFPSQIGQDRWVSEKVFPGVRNGYFLDVGSGDGVIYSNTWALERRGWKGICVDPFPTNMAGRSCQIFREVVDAEGGRKISFAKAGQIGGITSYLERWKEDARAADTVELTTVTLGDILRRAQAPAHIHFMSLDIEGAELEALQGFPFDAYTLGALAIEHNYEQPKRTRIEQFLGGKGYIRERTWMQDDFYVPRSAAR